MRGVAPPVALALNVGSSSVKFALYRRASNPGREPERLLRGEISRIGLRHASFRAFGPRGALETPAGSRYRDTGTAVESVLRWIDERPEARRIDALGHRVVHGGLRYRAPTRISPSVLRSLRTLVPLDPEHLPGEIRCIEVARRHYPTSVQVACFDTAFHRRMLPPAQIYGIPRALARTGVVRYGFHGLSYQSIVRGLGHSSGRRPPRRLIVAHLGSGSSLCAIRNGRSLDTTMGFSPAGGLVMSRRSGDLDPNVVLFVAEREGLSAARLRELFNEESGLLGVSGRTGDMADLLRAARPGSSARQAIDLFCYQVQQRLAALTVALGGLDAVVFTAGIGENAPAIRRQICEPLGHLGIRLDPRRNSRNAREVSAPDAPVRVWVIPTDEESEVARATFGVCDSI
jgi:acetate kinase